jgi:hypothetical protein
MSEEQGPWMREPTPEENPEGLGILRPEEDEPDFSPIIERAKARIARVDFDDPHVTFELETIRDLLAVIDHLECEIDAMEHHISESGLHCEAEDEPGYFDAPRCGDEGAPLCAACSVPAHELTQVPGCGGPLP